MTRFIDKVGAPGEFFGIEGLSMILRLGSVSGALLVASMGLTLSGLLLSFARACSGGFASSMTAFSLSGFLAVVFIPVDLSVIPLATPRSAVALDICFLFVFALLLRALMMNIPDFLKTGEGVGAMLPSAALTVLGCLLLVSIP
jgi:hypothetical protein